MEIDDIAMPREPAGQRASLRDEFGDTNRTVGRQRNAILKIPVE